MRRASCMSFGIMVTRLAWMAQRLVSSKRPTMQDSAASWSARTAELWKRRSFLNSEAISRTSLQKGSLRMRSSVDFWKRLISRRATVPGRKRWGFLTPPAATTFFEACLWAMCFLGALPPVFLRAVCFVRAIIKVCFKSNRELSVKQVSNKISAILLDKLRLWLLSQDFGPISQITQ